MKVEKFIDSLTILTVLLAIMAGSSAPVKANDKDALTVVMHAPPQNIDPHNNTALTAEIHALLVYDTLFAADEKFEIRPQMVESWDISDDKLTYTFTLREGLMFHDGAPVKANDVIASLRRFTAGDSVGKMMMERTSEFRKISDRTFQVILKEPFGLVLFVLSQTRAVIMPERTAKTPHTEPITDHTGSGPFVFVKEKFRPMARAVYIRNDAYVPRNETPNGFAGGKVAHIKQLVWKNIPDHITAINALKAGKIDYLEVMPHDLLAMVKEEKDIVVNILNTAGRQGMLRMNWLHPPFDNPKIRKAVGYAISQQEYLQATYGDPQYYRTCKSVYSCKSPFMTEIGAQDLMEGNIDKAKALLKAAGYDGTPVVIINPTDVSYLAPYGLITAQALRKAGMNVQVQAMDWGTLAKRRGNAGPVSEGGWNIFHTSWPSDNLANPLVNRPLVCTGQEGGAWFGWPKDEQISKWVSSFPNIVGSEDQKKLTEQIQSRAYEIGTHYVIGEFMTPSARRSSITGVLKSSTPIFWNIRKE